MGIENLCPKCKGLKRELDLPPEVSCDCPTLEVPELPDESDDETTTEVPHTYDGEQ
jgi:hypothetical protein